MRRAGRVGIAPPPRAGPRARAENALRRPSNRSASAMRRRSAAQSRVYENRDIDGQRAPPNNQGVIARVLSAALVGVEAALVRVEVDVTAGLPAFTTVGLPDSAVRESRERVRTAIRNAGFAFPLDRITVNLAPADIRKEGASFDLPIALGILTATGVVKNSVVGPYAVVGELALDGQIQPVRGTLAVGLACRRQGIDTLVVPVENAAEALAVDRLHVLAAPTLSDRSEERRVGKECRTQWTPHHLKIQVFTQSWTRR